MKLILGVAIALASILPAPCLAEGTGPSGHLLINEVDAGPHLSYIEIVNAGSSPASLEGVSLETSQGSFSLAELPGPLGPSEHALLYTVRPEQAAISDDPETMIVLVGSPVVSVLTDTVLLKQEGSVLDACSYGVAQDTSSRYVEAVAAGELSAGSFIDVSAQRVGELCFGRSANSDDTDDLDSDWGFSGGRNAVAGSPLEANDAVLGGEAFSIEAFQQVVCHLGVNTYLNFDVVTAAYEDYTGSDSHSSAVHRLTIRGDGVGLDVQLAGPVSFDFEPWGVSGSRVTMEGTLTGPSGIELQTRIIQTVSSGGFSGVSDVKATLVLPTRAWHYNEVITLAASGVRGNYSIAQSRLQQGAYGVERCTSGSVSAEWLVVGGQLLANDFAVTIERDWPISDLPLPLSIRRDPFTTESFAFTGSGEPSADGLGYVVSINDYVAVYGGFPSASYTNAYIEFDYDPVSGQTVGVNHMDVDYDSTASTVHVTSTLTEDPEAKFYTVGTEVLINGVLVDQSLATVDPPVVIDWGYWKKKAKRAAKATARYGLIGITGAACAVGTTAAGAIAVGATVGSAGTLTPGGVLLVGGMGGLCAVATTMVCEIPYSPMEASAKK